MAKKFSTDLLVDEDGFPLYYSRLEDDLKSLSDVGSFFKKLGAIEARYAKDVQSLCKTVDPKLWKRTDKEIGTVSSCWQTIHAELDKIAKLHEDLSNKGSKDIYGEVENWLKEKDKTKKKLVKDGGKLTKDMHEMMSTLKRSKETYYKLHKDADNMLATYNQKKADPAAKPKDVEKLNKKSIEARDKANHADGNYKKTLEKANAHRVKFYTQDMPALLDEFQAFEEQRTGFIKKIVEDYMTTMNQLPPLLASTTETINNSVEAIDKQADIDTFIAENAALAVTPPPAIDYEPYDANAPTDSAATSSGVLPATPASRIPGIKSRKGKDKGKDKLGKTQKSTELLRENKGNEANGGLSREAEIEARLKELKEQIATEVKSKKGLDKLVKFYATDPVAQKKAQQEATDQQAKVDKLKEEQKQLEQELEGIRGNAHSTEATDSESAAEPSAAANNSISKEDQPDAEEEDDGEYVEVKAKALFDYDAANETELGFKAGDILTITEQDESGWWYAELNGKQGFIPNNYVEELEEKGA
ncbi:cell division cycle-related protein [Balamuthia mandrillaris]